MSSTVTIQISKSDTFTPENILKDVERNFDHTKNIDTLVEIEANDLLPYYFKVWGRAKYNVPSATGESRWSNTRHFRFLLDHNTIVGFTQTTTNTVDNSWNSVAKNGEMISRPDFKSNAIFKLIKDNVVDEHGNIFVEIPKVYIKTLPTGIPSTFSNNKKTWMISPIKYDDDFKVHPAFIRQGKEYNKIRIAKYRCKQDINNVLKSNANDGLFLTGISTNIPELRNRISEIDNRYRLFDIYDLSLLKILLMAYTIYSRPVSTWLTFKDGDPNSILKLAEFTNNQFCHYVDRILLTNKNKTFNLLDHSTSNDLGTLATNINDYSVWTDISKDKVGDSNINGMDLFLPLNTVNNFTGLLGATKLEGSNTNTKYMFLHAPWSRNATYTYTKEVWDPQAHASPVYQWDYVGRACMRCGYYKAKYITKDIKYSERFGPGPSCPKFINTGSYYGACSLGSSVAPCMTPVGCTYVINQISEIYYICSYFNTSPKEGSCNLIHHYNYTGGYVTKTFTQTINVAADSSIFSALYSANINNRTIRLAYNVD